MGSDPRKQEEGNGESVIEKKVINLVAALGNPVACTSVLSLQKTRRWETYLLTPFSYYLRVISEVIASCLHAST